MRPKLVNVDPPLWQAFERERGEETGEPSTVNEQIVQEAPPTGQKCDFLWKCWQNDLDGLAPPYPTKGVKIKASEY